MQRLSTLTSTLEQQQKADAFVALAVSRDGRWSADPIEAFVHRGHVRFVGLAKAAVDAILSSDAAIALSPLATAFVGMVERESSGRTPRRRGAGAPRCRGAHPDRDRHRADGRGRRGQADLAHGLHVCRPGAKGRRHDCRERRIFPECRSGLAGNVASATGQRGRRRLRRGARRRAHEWCGHGGQRGGGPPGRHQWRRARTSGGDRRVRQPDSHRRRSRGAAGHSA